MPGNAVSDLLRAEVSLVGVTVLLTMAALGFSCYSISHPRFTFRRLAAVLHLLTAVSTIAVIQLVDTSQVNRRQTSNSQVMCNIVIRKCLRNLPAGFIGFLPFWLCVILVVCTRM